MKPTTAPNLAELMSAPAVHNLYPMANEIHGSTLTAIAGSFTFPQENDGTKLFCDELSGRVFSGAFRDLDALYGDSERMNYYTNVQGLPIVGELRVPYRRIPIYEVSELVQLQSAVASVVKHFKTSGFTPLIRGQNQLYLTKQFGMRSEDEFANYYGCVVDEPSFLPSFLRFGFSEIALRSIWHAQAALVLNDISVDLKGEFSEARFDQYKHDEFKLQAGPLMDYFALAIAQHYGMPSVGLDLTDSSLVATWFALNTLDVNDGIAIVDELEEDAAPTIFVFSCPEISVFDYSDIRLSGIPDGRPDRQKSWFGHVGWGMARNQLANYLVCAFRLDRSIRSDLPEELAGYLFPHRKDDPILDAFLNQRANAKYVGEARRALRSVYDLEPERSGQNLFGKM